MQDFLHFVTQNSWLVGLFFLLLILLLVNEAYQWRQSTQKLPPAAVIHLMNQEKAQVIDIRDKNDFKAGHITGAISVSMSEISDKKTIFSEDKPIVVVCKLGQTAQTAASILKKQGYNKVVVLAGGITAWKAEGLPVIKA
jgi:rhodanese-related sulfurtransferase